MGRETRFGRREFLVLATGGVAGAIFIGIRVSAVDQTPFYDLFGPGVAEIGRIAVLGGADADVAAVIAALPSAGTKVVSAERAWPLEIVDLAAFSEAVHDAVTVELADGALAETAGYLLTPTEVALAVAVHSSRS